MVEFNARFGDPEAEAVLPLLDSDLAEIALACVRGDLRPEQVRFRDEASAVIVLAAPGYPAQQHTGIPPHLPIPGAGAKIFQAGTALHAGQLVLERRPGGRRCRPVPRCLNTALGRAYRLADAALFAGAQLRGDIGARIGAVPDPAPHPLPTEPVS